jgi:hypothetical protein
MASKTVRATKTGRATKQVKVLEEGLRRLEDNQLACRDMRHAWAVEEDYHAEPQQTAGRKVVAIKRVLVCMRGCETRRVEHYVAARYGLDKISQHYTYLNNYTIPGVPRGVKPSVVIQQESYRRAMERIAGTTPREREAADR